MSETGTSPADGEPARAARAAMLNLSRFHRQHERHYALAPLESALALGRAARTLTTLADRWTEAPAPAGDRVRVPFAGCEDLNDPAVIPSDGVLFMEGEGEPAELARLRRDVTAIADDNLQTAEWLAAAMEAAWATARGLSDPRLADLLGERHRIIANDWQAAGLSALVGRLARRAVELLERADLSPEGVRADLAGPGTTPRLLHSSAELLDRAADLAAGSAVLLHDNERRWRLFRARVEALDDGAP
jgi:hypothetical protein